VSHETLVYRQELTPIHFIERAGEAYAERIAAVDGDTAYDWRQFRSRARQFASGLRKQGLARDDRVAFLAFNTEPLLLAHFGVPMARGVLVAINTRWSAQEIAYVIGHCGARSICISRIDLLPAWRSFDSGVTHFCAAPTVLIMLANDAAAHRLSRPVRIFTAGAPPSPTLIARMAELNFELDHVYGLTETYGPYTINIPSPRAEASAESQAKLRARQGFSNLLAGETRVVDDRMQEVPRDGATLGEVVMRGNVVMKGYFDDPEATARAFEGGWFHSGDLAVVHADGAIELRDRKKDIIISGGENISTIEVEQAVASHPAVMECAVIAVPHAKWGEVPKAFVVLKPGIVATAMEIVDHCRARVARFKVPHSVEFGELPKTSTGKIQKFVLREREWRNHDKRIN